MASPAMRRYRRTTSDEDALIGDAGDGRIDCAALFGRSAPLRLEFGCGHGEFISQMAAAHPEVDFIGVEVDWLRVNKCAHKCMKADARNVRLYAGEAAAFITRLPDAAFERIYILFPDPWPKLAHRRRRLVNRAFLLELARVAAPGCRLVFASDTHNYAMQVLANVSTIPGRWRSLHPSGYRIDVPVRFETVFERHKRAEGCTIANVQLERTSTPNSAK
ncbi:MAG: methyltransferase domain-containing protein [Planctomycetota bacterium]